MTKQTQTKDPELSSASVKCFDKLVFSVTAGKPQALGLESRTQKHRVKKGVGNQLEFSKQSNKGKAKGRVRKQGE